MDEEKSQYLNILRQIVLDTITTTYQEKLNSPEKTEDIDFYNLELILEKIAANKTQEEINALSEEEKKNYKPFEIDLNDVFYSNSLTVNIMNKMIADENIDIYQMEDFQDELKTSFITVLRGLGQSKDPKIIIPNNKTSVIKQPDKIDTNIVKQTVLNGKNPDKNKPEPDKNPDNKDPDPTPPKNPNEPDKDGEGDKEPDLDKDVSNNINDAIDKNLLLDGNVPENHEVQDESLLNILNNIGEIEDEIDILMELNNTEKLLLNGEPERKDSNGNIIKQKVDGRLQELEAEFNTANSEYNLAKEEHSNQKNTLKIKEEQQKTYFELWKGNETKLNKLGFWKGTFTEEGKKYKSDMISSKLEYDKITQEIKKIKIEKSKLLDKEKELREPKRKIEKDLEAISELTKQRNLIEEKSKLILTQSVPLKKSIQKIDYLDSLIKNSLNLLEDIQKDRTELLDNLKNPNLTDSEKTEMEQKYKEKSEIFKTASDAHSGFKASYKSSRKEYDKLNKDINNAKNAIKIAQEKITSPSKSFSEVDKALKNYNLAFEKVDSIVKKSKGILLGITGAFLKIATLGMTDFKLIGKSKEMIREAKQEYNRAKEYNKNITESKKTIKKISKIDITR